MEDPRNKKEDPDHDGIENVITCIEPMYDEKGKLDKTSLKIHIKVIDENYGIVEFTFFNESKGIVIIDEEKKRHQIANCYGILKLEKDAKLSKHEIKTKSKFKAESRKYDCNIAIIDENDKVDTPIDTKDTLFAFNHNPRHRVIDPVGGG